MVTYAPIACRHKVSGSISLPSRGSFHLSLTVLFAIGHQVVFRLGGWAPRLPTGFHVSGGTLDPLSDYSLSNTGLVTLCGGTFQSASSSKTSFYECPQPHSKLWFGLFPVRSPLLRKSMFLSSPTGT